jgi:hypothetical protein
VGLIGIDISDAQAFLYWNTTMTNIGAIICPSDSSTAMDINNFNQTVGYCYNDNSLSAPIFLYNIKDNNISFIGNSSTRAYLGQIAPLAINNLGQIVGTLDSFPFLFSNSVPYNICDLVEAWPVNVQKLFPIDINDNSQIIADLTYLNETTENSVTVTVLLTPID